MADVKHQTHKYRINPFTEWQWCMCSRVSKTNRSVVAWIVETYRENDEEATKEE